MIIADRVGVHFLFDHAKRVVTPASARVRRRGAETWGLRDVTFRLEPGNGVALIGRSGSGKTSLLRLIAGVYSPDAGRIEVRGKVASLLSADAGLISLLTGRENALLLAVLGGLSRSAARRVLEDVKSHSRLGDYFELPVLSYSQGMRARLGFAVADQMQPSILLLDEVHEVLDHEFRNVIEQHAHALLEAGGIVIAAGHDHAMLARLCQSAIHLEGGSIRGQGPFDQIQREYFETVNAAGESSA